MRHLAWISLGSAVVLLMLAAGAQLFLLLNPYQRAARDITALLATQPSIENNLDRINTATASLSDHLALYAAESLIRTEGSAQTERARAAFARWGIPGRDVTAFSGLMKSLASEILNLSNSIQQESLAVNLSPLLAEILREGGWVSATIDQLYTQIPAALEQIANQRLRLRTVANGASIIFETPQFAPLLNALAEVYAPPIALSDPDLLYYALAAHSWVELPALCESLEIQLANTEIVLREIFSVVLEARRAADRLGYDQIEPPVEWINQRIPVIIPGSAGLILTASASLAWMKRASLRPPRPAHLIKLFASAVRLARQNFIRLRRIMITSLADCADRLKTHLKMRTAPRPPAAPPPVESCLHVIQTGLPRAVRRLSRDRPLRISSDPRGSIYISSARPGAIEIQIRPSKAGFFIEVLTSEAPVLLNNQPILGARRLTDGDAIQILDTRLLFQEG